MDGASKLHSQLTDRHSSDRDSCWNGKGCPLQEQHKGTEDIPTWQLLSALQGPFLEVTIADIHVLRTFLLCDQSWLPHSCHKTALPNAISLV